MRSASAPPCELSLSKSVRWGIACALAARSGRVDSARTRGRAGGRRLSRGGGLRRHDVRVRLRLRLALFPQLRLLVWVEAREQVEPLAACRNGAEVSEFVFEDASDLQVCGLRRRPVEELVELALRDGFEFGQVVVIAGARQLDGHLPERVDSVRVVDVVASVDLAPAHAVVNDLLLAAQIAQIRAHVRPELAVFAALSVRTLLRGDGGDGGGGQKDQKDELGKGPLYSHRSPLPANADRAARLDSRLNLVGVWEFGTGESLSQFRADG